jgi:hypothetical protein
MSVTSKLIQNAISSNDEFFISGAIELVATDKPNHCWQITCKVDSGHIYISLQTNQFAIEPTIEIDECIRIGVEQSAFFIDSQTNKLVSEINDLTYFQWFEEIDKTRLLLFSETQVLLTTKRGEIIWRNEIPDVVVDNRLTDNVLSISTMEGDLFRVDISTGHWLK